MNPLITTLLGKEPIDPERLDELRQAVADAIIDLTIENRRLREQLARISNTINVVGSPYDRIISTLDELVRDIKKDCRTALTENRDG